MTTGQNYKTMKIAVIGGIGCGKSEVMLAFERAGYVTLSADKINAALWQDEGYLNTLKINFPEAVINGVITRATLGAVAFGDYDKLQKLNNISHPLIIGKIMDTTADNLAVELPLALESGILDTFDKVIMVDTKRSIRLKRLEKRGLTKKRAKEIMSVQVPVRKLKKSADIIISNNGTREDVSAVATAIATKLKV